MTSLPNRPGHAAPSIQPGPRRDDDRLVAVTSVAIAAGYLATAALAAAAVATPGSTLPAWLPLHLALAGGASTAIAGVMPFFAAALVAGHPADRRVRWAAILLVATGAALVSLRGVVTAATALPALGGTLYLAGIGCTALALRGAGRRGLMVRRPIVSLAYALALANVAVGASLGTLFAAGWLPVVERWGLLKPAHAWTNLIGFVSLVITGTLLHFLPTVVGARIVARRSAIVSVLGLALGSPLVVAGFALGSWAVASGGALLTLIGAWSLVAEMGTTVRARGRWTTDPGWHRMSGVGLVLGTFWFAAGVTLASWLVLDRGAVPDAWSTPLVGAPLAIGWVAQVLIGSWTHLLPAIGPGGPVLHARRRVILGRLATPRLLALNGGALLAAIGWPAGIPGLAVPGVLLAGAAVLASGALAVVALRERAPA
jgi:nitrite reductase (NO-forming)